jgi:hypothetical protein
MFVDGLLGIGAAGGKSSANEGAMLASRLKTMRQERSARAPVIKKKEAVAGTEAPGPPPSQPSADPQKTSRRKNKRKKGKK